MNFMDRMEGEEIQVELKYCERCGGLWLRSHGADGVYCSSCRVFLEARPNPPAITLHKARRRKQHGQQTNISGEDLQGMARIDYLQGVAAMEVWG
jgi:Zn-finger nucleic acid-binding protein